MGDSLRQWPGAFDDLVGHVPMTDENGLPLATRYLQRYTNNSELDCKQNDPASYTGLPISLPSSDPSFLYAGLHQQPLPFSNSYLPNNPETSFGHRQQTSAAQKIWEQPSFTGSMSSLSSLNGVPDLISASSTNVSFQNYCNVAPLRMNLQASKHEPRIRHRTSLQGGCFSDSPIKQRKSNASNTGQHKHQPKRKMIEFENALRSAYSRLPKTHQQLSEMLFAQFRIIVEEVEDGSVDTESNEMSITTPSTQSSMSLDTSESLAPSGSTSSVSTTPRPYNSDTQALESMGAEPHEKVKYYCTYSECLISRKTCKCRGRKCKCPRKRECYWSYAKSDLRRHEKGDKHWPEETYMCLKCPITVDDLDGDSLCSFCFIPFSILGVDPEAHYLQCELARKQGRTWVGRKDHLCTHLSEEHNMSNMGEITKSWCFPIDSDWPRQCGFCGVYFHNRDERFNHVVEHFESGSKIKDWKLPFPRPKDEKPSGPFPIYRKDDNDDDDDNSDGGFGGNGGSPGGKIFGFGTPGPATRPAQHQQTYNYQPYGSYQQEYRRIYSGHDLVPEFIFDKCQAMSDGLLEACAEIKVQYKTALLHFASPSDGGILAQSLLETAAGSSGFDGNHATPSPNRSPKRSIALERYLTDSGDRVPGLAVSIKQPGFEFDLGYAPSGPDVTLISILLQGNRKKAKKNIFLIPDKFGSTTSFTTLPSFGQGIAVWGLDCSRKIATRKATSNCKVLGQLILHEIRRRQPQGTFHIGGWCTGHVLLDEVIRHLIDEGSQVAKPILFDDPSPGELHHEFIGNASADVYRSCKSNQQDPSDQSASALSSQFAALLRMKRLNEVTSSSINTRDSRTAQNSTSSKTAMSLPSSSLRNIPRAPSPPSTDSASRKFRNLLMSYSSEEAKQRELEDSIDKLLWGDRKEDSATKNIVRDTALRMMIRHARGHITLNVFKTWLQNRHSLCCASKPTVRNENLSDRFERLGDKTRHLLRQNTRKDDKIESYLFWIDTTQSVTSQHLSKFANTWNRVSTLSPCETEPTVKSKIQDKKRIPARTLSDHNIQAPMKGAPLSIIPTEKNLPPRAALSSTLALLSVVTELAWQIDKVCKNLTEALRELSPDILALQTVLKVVERTLPHLPVSEEMIIHLTTTISNSQIILQSIQRLLEMHKCLECGTKHISDEAKWRSSDIADLKTQLTSNLVALNTLISCTTTSSLATRRSLNTKAQDHGPERRCSLNVHLNDDHVSQLDCPVYDQRLDKFGRAISATLRAASGDELADSLDDGSYSDYWQWNCDCCIPTISYIRPPVYNVDNCSCENIDRGPGSASVASLRQASKRPFNDINFRRPKSYASFIQSDGRPEGSERKPQSFHSGICYLCDEQKAFNNLEAHTLAHRIDRPERCPFQTCDYHLRGFARKYDKTRHTLTHYKSTMVSEFCPGSGSAAEKSFNSADVFKEHLATVFELCQTTPNIKKSTSRSLKTETKLEGYAPDATGKCSIRISAFSTAQRFYDHLDGCILGTVSNEEESNAARKVDQTGLPRPSKRSREQENFPEQQQLKTRNHIFVVDDVTIKKPWRNQVRILLGLLSSQVTNCDPEDLNFVFTSSSNARVTITADLTKSSSSPTSAYWICRFHEERAAEMSNPIFIFRVDSSTYSQRKLSNSKTFVENGNKRRKLDSQSRLDGGNEFVAGYENDDYQRCSTRDRPETAMD